MVVRYLPNATASEELYHHGVDDQKWGVRHGPPYPLDPSPAKQAIRKKKSVGLIQRFKNKRKGKKLREAKERKKKEREEIDKAVKAGNAAKVEKLQSKMSDEDLVKAINRLNLSQSVATLKTAESMRRMEKGRAFLSTSANIATSAANIVESVSRAKSAIDKITGKANSDEDSVLKALKKELDYSKTQSDMSKNVLDKLKNERLVKMLNDADTNKETINNILGISKGGKGVSEERVRELIEELSHSDLDELYHYGVEGQKWGVRRYQNKDGTLTAEGYKHYGRQRKAAAVAGAIAGTGVGAGVGIGSTIATNALLASLGSPLGVVSGAVMAMPILLGSTAGSEIGKKFMAKYQSKKLSIIIKDDGNVKTIRDPILKRDTTYVNATNENVTNKQAIKRTVKSNYKNIGPGDLDDNTSVKESAPKANSQNDPYKLDKSTRATEYGAVVKYTNGNKTWYGDKHTGEKYTKEQAQKVEDEWNKKFQRSTFRV